MMFNKERQTLWQLSMREIRATTGFDGRYNHHITLNVLGNDKPPVEQDDIYPHSGSKYIVYAVVKLGTLIVDSDQNRFHIWTEKYYRDTNRFIRAADEAEAMNSLLGAFKSEFWKPNCELRVWLEKEECELDGKEAFKIHLNVEVLSGREVFGLEKC